MASVLAHAFAIRFARGISPVLVAALLSGATRGLVASGNLNVAEGDYDHGSNSIGYQDLIDLKKALNPTYRQLGAAWLMNDNTLTDLQALTDTVGHPVIAPNDHMLLGYPVGICPAMDDIGPGAKPIAFYAPRYLAVRRVTSPSILVNTERWAVSGQIGYQSFLRMQGALCVPNNGPNPAVYIQNNATS